MTAHGNGNGSNGLYGAHGRALVVDLSTGEHYAETIPADVFRQYLGGYGLGAWLMWKHFPTGAEATAPEACFALVSGLLTGLRTPFSGRIQIVGKSPLTGTWADSNSGGSTAIHLRHAGYDALIVRGRAAEPSVLVVNAEAISIEPAGDLWGAQIPEAFDALQGRYGTKFRVGVSAIGPAGERGARIASVMNDRYHAFGRQGFGAIFGSKNLKAVVVDGGENTGDTVPIRDAKRFRALCESVREGIRPADFRPHARMKGEGDGLLEAGPLAGVRAPLEQLKRDYYQAMDWDSDTGRLSRGRAEQLGMAELLDSQLA